MRRAGDTLLLVALLCVCAALLYLDWRRQGEVELLHERLERVNDRAEHASYIAERAWGLLPEHVADVDRILRATDDRTLADIARGNA